MLTFNLMRRVPSSVGLNAVMSIVTAAEELCMTALKGFGVLRENSVSLCYYSHLEAPRST